jgi:hemolysin type calcium-binding protein
MKVKFLVLGVAGMLAVAAAASAARLDVVYGTAGADTLAGTTGADVIYARAGSDTVRAHAGNDVVYGGAGNDVMWPGAGVDVQYGGKGNDVLHALANDNQPDILDCGPGFDTAIVIAHDPARFRGCEQIVRLSPEEAASLAASGGDS